MVSSFLVNFKKVARMTEDREEAKKEHRQTLHDLIYKYANDVQLGKADGIRNAKELVEVMKMDLLLMGDATERTENVNELDELRVQKISQVIDLNNDNIRKVLSDMVVTLNDTNDEADIGTNKKSDANKLSDLDGASVMADEGSLEEIAKQAVQDYIDSNQPDDNEPEQ